MPKNIKKRAVAAIPGDSEGLDRYFIKLTTVLNALIKTDRRTKKLFCIDKSKIIYLPLIYVESLREVIVQMYQKSNDPITRGYMSVENLDWIMDHVQYKYAKTKPNKEKLVRKSAFIFYNINSKHPFTDGNKRTSIITANAFLEYNSYTIGSLPFRKSKKFITDVAMGKKSEKDCQAFIRKHISKLQLSKKVKTKIIELKKRLNKESVC